MPGPGAYTSSPNKYKNSPQWGLGTAERSEMGNKFTKSFPGPNVYDIKTKVGEGPKFVMGVKTEDTSGKANKIVPGPGAYSPTKPTDVSNSYTMGSKTKFGMNIAVNPESGTHTKMATNIEKTPAPGQYETVTIEKNVKSGNRFGNEPRPGMGAKGAANVPAPNAYNQDAKKAAIKSAPSYGFGTSRRPQTVNPAKQAPGPGTYNLKGITGTEGHAKTLTGRPNTSR